MTTRYKPNTTVACIIQAGDKYLMVEEFIDGKLKYNQPAGHLEPKESLVAACMREVKEETGLTLAPQGLVGIYQYSAAGSLAFVRFTFFVELDEIQVSVPEDPAINATKWLTYQEIKQLKQQLRSPLVLGCLDDFRNRQTYPLAILNDQLL